MKILNNIKRLGLLAATVSSSSLMALTKPASTDGGFATSVWAIFDKGHAYIQLGLLVAAVYGGYKLFIADDKSVLNWFLFGAGAGGIGAYDTIADLIIGFVKVT
jgi:hypothetical protein